MKRPLGIACLGLLLLLLVYEFRPDGSTEAAIPEGVAGPVRKAIARLRSIRPSRRCEAAFELGRLQDAAAAPYLIPLLADREDAMSMPERWLSSAMLGGRSREVRECAAAALRQLGSAATPWLIRTAAGDSGPETRRRAIQVLSLSSDPRATVFMERLLEDPDPELRIAALTAVVQNRHPRKAEAIHRALQDSDARVRLQALVHAAAGSEDWVYDALLRAAGDADAEVRGLAADRLGLRGDHRALDILIDRLSDGDLGVRQRAHSSLRKLTREDYGLDPAAWRNWRKTAR